jgi:hypothetical protein
MAQATPHPIPSPGSAALWRELMLASGLLRPPPPPPQGCAPPPRG